MKFVALIPARKGSSRVKNKNIRIVKKKPLINWTIEYSKKIKIDKDIVVSSDSLAIKKICKKYKGIIFMKRPKKFSTNKSPMEKVIIHTLNQLKKYKNLYDYVVILQPTSPLRKKNLVEKGMNYLNKNKKFNALYHLSPVKDFTGRIINQKEFVPDFSLDTRSQDIPEKFIPTGNLFIFKAKIFYYNLFKKKKLFKNFRI